MNLARVIFSWGVGDYGWGVIGINFMLEWPGMALTCLPGSDAKLPEGDPRSYLLASRIEQSRQWRSIADKVPGFICLGHDLWTPHQFLGDPQIAFPVFEDVDQVRQNVDWLRSYPIVITASRWNHDVLAELGIESHMVHQGYDPVLFNPSIRRPRTDGRFRVFSGGKAEWRKGQDLVLEGFKIFAEKHDDAVLHAAWASPWPQLAASLAPTRMGAPPGSHLGLPNYKAWAWKAGIRPEQFEVVALTPNHLMPSVLADMDCAVFASRIEGGTNIAAMECLGCGIPTILSDSTGHRDLPNSYPADKPEEIANALTLIYDNPIWPATGIMTHFAWPKRIAELVGVLKDV